MSSASLSPFNAGGHLPQLQRPPSESSIHSSLASSVASYNSHSGLQQTTSVPLPFSRLLKHLSRPSARRPILISFSLQAMNNASCPGVYIRSPNGLTVEEALEVSSASGSDPNVRNLQTFIYFYIDYLIHYLFISILIFDFIPNFLFCSSSQVQIFTVNELNPMIEEARSASLAAELIYWFLLGFTNRRPRANLPTQNVPSQPLYRMDKSFIKTTLSGQQPQPQPPLQPQQRSPILGNREFELSQEMMLAASLLSLSDAQDEA